MVIDRPEGEYDRLLVARLDARIAALEEALARRSRELRELQRHLCPRDLAILERTVSGMPAVPRGPFEPELWDDSPLLRAAEAPETLRSLWESLSVEHGAELEVDVGDPD